MVHAIWRTCIDALRRHSVLALFVGFMAAYTAKSMWYGDYFNPHRHPGIPEVPFLDFLTADLLFFGLAIAAVVVLENLHRALRLLTVPLGVFVGLLSLLSAFWLANTGLQPTYSILRAALTRFGDAVPIIVKSVQTLGLVLLLGSLAALAALPFLFRARWRKEAPHPRSHRWYATGLAGLLLLLGALGLALESEPRLAGWRLNAANVLVNMVRDMNDPFLREPQHDLPRPPVIAREDKPGPKRPPSIVLFMYEALSYRASSFGEPRHNRTPFLAQLARRGLSTRRMRAVMPHTSKSIVSFVCGRYPAMQNAILETADNYGMRCLPHVLEKHGYRSALFQSADGAFEDRPRLAANMGFDDFLAWPGLDTPRLGYLASDDRKLLPRVTKWIEQRDGPYLMLVVTSLTHHTYAPPADHPQAAKVRGLKTYERYHWLVRYLDRVFADLVQWLHKTGRLDDTIVAAFGDHGEAFGEHGVYWHDNTYYEEGLRVPLVIFAPGRITRPTVVEGNRSLLDLPPTLLELCRISYREDAFHGHSLLRPAPDVPRYFACWYDNTCVGQVRDRYKHVLLPAERSWVRYDLAADPGESKARLEAAEDRELADDLAQWQARHRYSTLKAERKDRTLYERWRCPARDTCTYREP